MTLGWDMQLPARAVEQLNFLDHSFVFS